MSQCGGLKAQNMTAQGNAPGLQVHRIFQALKGRHKLLHRIHCITNCATLAIIFSKKSMTQETGFDWVGFLQL